MFLVKYTWRRWSNQNRWRNVSSKVSRFLATRAHSFRTIIRNRVENSLKRRSALIGKKSVVRIGRFVNIENRWRTFFCLLTPSRRISLIARRFIFEWTTSIYKTKRWQTHLFSYFSSELQILLFLRLGEKNWFFVKYSQFYLYGISFVIL